MNETLQDIQNRFSCRCFLPQMPEADKIQAIAEAACQAPSSMNFQPWRVVVVRNAGLLAELDAESMKVIADMPNQSTFKRMQKRGGTVLYGAPCVVFVPIDASKPPAGAALDCGIVCQNITLAAQALGLGSCICGLVKLAFTREKAAYFKEKLCFPAGYEVGMAVLLGIPAAVGAPHKPDGRKITYID